jgi:hypothetical protein
MKAYCFQISLLLPVAGEVWPTMAIEINSKSVFPCVFVRSLAVFRVNSGPF